MFSTLFDYYYCGFLACRRVVVVDPISLFIPLKQNQFDMPSLSLSWRNEGLILKIPPNYISIEVALSVSDCL